MYKTTSWGMLENGLILGSLFDRSRRMGAPPLVLRFCMQILQEASSSIQHIRLPLKEVRRILWATPYAAGPSGDRSFGSLVKEVGQQTCRSADWTKCAQINDRALALQTRSSMRAAVEVSIHASRLVHEKRELSCNQSLFSCSVRR